MKKTTSDVSGKIQSLAELAATLKEARRRGRKIVHCHGVFDLVHPGHIVHFKEARKHGEAIFAEGDKGDRFYLILDGAVRISRMVPGMGEEALAVLKNGAYFGEMALIDDFPRSAHAIVHEKCRSPRQILIARQGLCAVPEWR